MPATKTFEYKILNSSGKQVKGRLSATNEQAAAQTLRQQGGVPLSITESGTGLRMETKTPRFGGRVSLKDLAVFARQFATMTNSGLSLLRSLAIMEEQSENETF